MTRALFLPCSRTKLRTRAAVPAIDLYDGPLFRVVRKYLDSDPKDAPKVWIVSAKHGVIHATKRIKVYDARLPSDVPSALVRRARQVIEAAYAAERWKEAAVCGGPAYQSVVIESAAGLRPRPELRSVTGSIGGQASRLLAWLEEPEEPTPAEPHQCEGRATLLGTTVVMSSEDVIRLARAHAAKDPLASDFQTWYIPVGRERVAPKWLVSLIFQKPVSRFRTADARRVLALLGVHCKYATRH